MTVLQAAAARRRKWMPWRRCESSQLSRRERECAPLATTVHVAEQKGLALTLTQPLTLTLTLTRYARNYLAGQKGKRALAQLGATDWEQEI